MSRTSTQWWAEIKDDKARFDGWLKRQLVGAPMAATRASHERGLQVLGLTA